MADRFFCATLGDVDRIVLEGEESRHLARVARRQAGEIVEVFDGAGLGLRAEILAIEKDRVLLRAAGRVVDRTPTLDLTVYVAPPKGERFDWLVEKLTELGVGRLVPIRAERSVVDPRSGKLDRLRRSVIEASKQSGRNRLMRLDEPISADAMIRGASGPVRLLADLDDRPAFDLARLEGVPGACVAIGPEGGWSPAERALAASSGWDRLELGPTRLRVETAAVAAAAILFSRAGGAVR